MLSKVFTLLLTAKDLFTENVTVYFCIKVHGHLLYPPPPPIAVQILNNWRKKMDCLLEINKR